LRDHVPAEERRTRLLLYRLGRALREDSSGQLRKDLMRESSPSRRAAQSSPLAGENEIMQVFARHQVHLARSEVASLLGLRSSSGALGPSMIADAMKIAESIPPEVPWAQQAVASASLAARADSATPLATQLATLGQAADAQSLCAVMGKHMELDEDGMETLLLVLDKKSDGKILVEPLVQWAIGIGFATQAAAAQIVSMQDMLDSLDSPWGEESGSSSPASPDDESRFKWESMVATSSPVVRKCNMHSNGRLSFNRRLSFVVEGDEEEYNEDSCEEEGRRSVAASEASEQGCTDDRSRRNSPEIDEAGGVDVRPRCASQEAIGRGRG